MLAFFKGRTDLPLIEESFPELLHRIAAEHADRDALVEMATGHRWTYRELADEVDSYAKALLARGLKRGDRVGIWSVNRAEWILTQYASASLGVTIVGLNTSHAIAELSYVLGNSEIGLVVAASGYRDADYGAMLEKCAAQGTVSRWVLFDTESWDEFLGAGASISDEALWDARSQVTNRDAYSLQYTSGTTGRPKGAIISQRAALNNAWQQGEVMNFTEKDRICLILPLFHAFGLIASTLTALTHGVAVVVSGPTFDATGALEAISREKCTTLHGVPTMYIALMEHPNLASFDVSSLRTGAFGGSQVPPSLVIDAAERLHLTELTPAFGQSENSSVACQTRPEDPLDRKVNSAGFPMAHTEMKIVDEQGNIQQTNEVGEILIRGYLVMDGYWRDPERTAQALDGDGWLHTGDLGQANEDGYFQIVGRSKDMIIRGGENIYPAEIEYALHEHDDIIEAQVVGIPDEKYGEAVCAIIDRRPGSVLDEEGVREYSRSQLAYFKIPQYVVFRARETFPKTSSGKIKKNVLREEIVAQLLSQTAH